MKERGFEIAKGYEDKDIHIPVRKTEHSAGYDVEAAEDVVISPFKLGCKPTLVPTGIVRMTNIFCLLIVVADLRKV